MSQIIRSAEVHKTTNQGNYAGLESYEEVNLLIEGITSKGGVVTSSVSNDAYCLTSKLNSTNGTWCIDSTGFSEIGECTNYQCNSTQEPIGGPSAPEAPTAPTCLDTTSDSITISTCSNCEYRINTESWTSSNIFTSLSSDTSYTLTRRIKASGETPASSSSSSTTCSTLAGQQSPSISVSDVTKTYGDESFTITYSTNSDGNKSFSSTNTDVATITNAGVVTIVGSGATTITFNTEATSSYSAGTDTATLTVDKATPICACSPTTKTYGDSAYTIDFTTNSPGTKSYSSGTTSVATISSTGLVTIVGVGTSTMTCSITSSTNYNAATCIGTQTVNNGDQAAPDAPTMSSNTETSITLNTCSGGGCEYRRDGGEWQSSTTFSGLTTGTSYSFTQRKAATTNYNASNESTSAELFTLCVITYNDNGGICSPSSRTVTCGSSVEAASCSKAGGNLTGYSITSGSCASGWNSSNGSCNSVTQNMTIRAEWSLYSGGQSKTVNISNNSGSSLSDYAVLVSPQGISDYSTIRFFDSSNQEIYHWVDDTSSPKKVWVKVPLIPTTGAVIYMYYDGSGNANHASDGKKVFPYFEDWENNTLNGWYASGSGSNVSTLASPINGSNFYMYSHMISSKYWGTRTWYVNSSAINLDNDTYKLHYWVYGMTAEGSSSYATSVRVNFGGTNIVPTYKPYPYNTWLNNTSGLISLSGSAYFTITSSAYYCAGTWYSGWDNFFIRKARSTEPVATIN